MVEHFLQATPTAKKYFGLVEISTVVWLVASNVAAFIKRAKLLAVVSFNSRGSHRLISALLLLPSTKVPLPPQFKFGCQPLHLLSAPQAQQDFTRMLKLEQATRKVGARLQ